jgi:hypothetical protein
VDSLERFQQSRAVIEDFSSQTLAAISSDFGRLYYVGSLKDEGSRRYEHDGLATLYADNAVQAALCHCHEELFSRILETPLRDQERDLNACLDAAADRYWDVVENWRETSATCFAPIWARCWPFFLPARLASAKPHRYTHHLADHLYFLGMAVNLWRTRR